MEGADDLLGSGQEALEAGAQAPALPYAGSGVGVAPDDDETGDEARLRQRRRADPDGEPLPG